MRKRMRLSPAMAVALIALFSSLTGVAAGVTVAKAVPLAKKALLANNSTKLQGKTVAQIIASVSMKSLVTVKTGSWAQTAAGVQGYTVTCDSGQKAIAGGWDQLNPNLGGAVSLSSFPTSDGSGWTVWIWNFIASAHSGTTYAICVK
jgi:hypothetical protein